MQHLAQVALWLGVSVAQLLRIAGAASQEQESELHELAIQEYWELAACWPQRFADRQRRQIERQVRALHNPATDGWRYLRTLAEALSSLEVPSAMTAR